MSFLCRHVIFVLPFVLAVAAWGQKKEALASGEVRDEGARLFELMEAEWTGIAFESRFENPELWRSLWRQYFIGSIGSGICLGDVNGDGLPDVFLVGKDSSNALYLNRGDFRFEDVTEAAGIAGSEGMAAGAAMVDIDNDGDLDLYVCFVGSANELFVNDGAGRFSERAEQWGLDLETGSNAPSFADYDRDGDLDLYLQCNYWEASENPAGMPDFLLENVGGEFVDVTEAAGIFGEGQGHAAIWWDFDEDGWQDVYVSNDFAEDDRLYRNNRDGTFSDVLRDTFEFAPYSAMGADLGDLNNDGHVDFFVGEMKPRDRAYYLKTVGPLSAKLFSIDRMGVGQYMQNVVSANVGPGQFADVGNLTGMAATNWTWAPRLVDLDTDGWLDAFFTNGMVRAFHDADLGVRVAKARSRREQVAHYQRSPVLEERNLAYRNFGDFRFEEMGAEWGLDLLGVSFASAFADFDGDGDLDLVVGNWEDEVSVYRNLSDRGDRLVVDLRGVESNRFGLGAKVTARVGDAVQVRELTSTRGYMATDEPAAFFAFEGAERVDELRVEWPSGVTQVLEEVKTGQRVLVEEEGAAEGFVRSASPYAEATEDTSPNRWPAAVRFVESGLSRPLGSESSEVLKRVDRDQALLPFSEDREGAPLLVEDLDGDGWLDVVLGGPVGTLVRVFRNRGGRSLKIVDTDVFEVTRESDVSSLVLLDYDVDGRKDLVLGNGGIEHARGDEALVDRVFLSRGGIDFVDAGDALLAKIPLSTGAMTVADFDGDGVEELLQAGGPIVRTYPLAELNRVFEIGDSGLRVKEGEVGRALADLGKPVDLKALDLDGDGDVDLVGAEQWGTPVVMWNEAGGLRRHEFGEEMNGYWASVEFGDLNGNGRIELLLGNLGLNTKYQVTEAEVPELYFSRDPVASPRLFIDAIRTGGESYPTETRTLHQMYLPEEMSRTGTYEAFGDMTVEEAFGEGVVAGLERLVLRELRSVVLLQEEGGHFKVMPLPHLAQAGRVVDSLLADLDSDGDLDAVLVNEPVSPQPWVALGPNKGHLTVLLNDGAGTFKALLPWESGLVIEVGQPKRLAWADLDGDGRGELLVGCSDGPLVVFELEI
ncbi:FG-GAP repeat domain protein [Verrucomicrobiia bacterium DG1235]|nr:FG-GAP repeat domain protein [Verrucomicrobiae bacterium DG1235]